MLSQTDPARRAACRTIASAAGLGAALLAAPAQAIIPRSLPGRNSQSLSPELQLNAAQSRVVRAWIAQIILRQLQSPSPRWQQRDCAGLVRFAVAESLREHDQHWRRANGLHGVPVPPEPLLTPAQSGLRHRWQLADGSRAAWVGALELVQENTVFVARQWQRAQIADLFLYDQGDAQHLMVWMGGYLAYHTGSVSKRDDGLRSVPLRKLLSWQDTRWQPQADNPNFAGIYRLQFLSAT